MLEEELFVLGEGPAVFKEGSLLLSEGLAAQEEL